MSPLMLSNPDNSKLWLHLLSTYWCHEGLLVPISCRTSPQTRVLSQNFLNFRSSSWHLFTFLVISLIKEHSMRRGSHLSHLLISCPFNPDAHRMSLIHIRALSGCCPHSQLEMPDESGVCPSETEVTPATIAAADLIGILAQPIISSHLH